MQAILEKLHNDHINFDRLLSTLEGQLRLLEDCETSDLDTTLDAVRYMKEYPDYVHHPMENTIFEYFQTHYEQANEHIHDLLAEHDDMPQFTDRLFEALQNAMAGFPQEREELCAILGEYISIQRKHMDREEVYVYPMINSRFNEEDWKQIDSVIAKVEDPLFGKDVHESYQRLFAQIMNR